MSSPIFNRTELLLGAEGMGCIERSRVIIFGVGGVGSWCAESLVRSGVSRLTVVDSDRVCITNINRQSMATSRTIGRVKVEALKERLLEINPSAEIEAVQEIYSASTASLFPLQDFDCIIDCIDSLKDKLDLILRATSLPPSPSGRQTLFLSSMGAALKMDPTGIHVSEFWKINGCPLAAVLRRRMRRLKMYPARKFLCVWGPEVLPNKGHAQTCGTSQCVCPKTKNGEGRADLLNHEWCTSKAQINGSMAHITAIFGFTLAGLVIQHLTAEA